MLLPEGLGWLRPHLDPLRATYIQLRAELDPIEAFERAFADTLDESDYERIQSFFDGEHDTTYGAGAGERAHTELRDLLEAGVGEPEDPTPAGDSPPEPQTAGEITGIERFYDEDHRRRASEEIKFGDRWSVGKALRCWELFWVVDTGELAALGPDLRVHDDDSILGDAVEAIVGFGDVGASTVVEVLCVEKDQSRLEQLLGEWQTDQDHRDSYLRLRERLGIV
jgi:hypothetical protein